MNEPIVGRIDYGLNALHKFKSCYGEVQNRLLVLNGAVRYTTEFNKVPDWPAIPESYNQVFEEIWDSMERLNQIVKDLYEMRYGESFAEVEGQNNVFKVYIFE